MRDLRRWGVRGKPRRSLREITKHDAVEEIDELETETRKKKKEEQQRDGRLRKRRRRLKAPDEIEIDVRRRSMRLKEENEEDEDEEEDLWKAPTSLREEKEEGEDLSSPPKEYNLRSKRRHRASKEFLKRLEEYERRRLLKRLPSSSGQERTADPPASHFSCDSSSSFSSSVSSSPSASFASSSSSSSSSSLEECDRAWEDGSAEGSERGSPGAKDAPEDPRSIAGLPPPPDASSRTHQSLERSVLRYSREASSDRMRIRERIRKSVTFAKDVLSPSPLRLPPAAAPTSVHRVTPPRDGYYYVVTYPRDPCPRECPMCYFRVFPSMFALDPRSLLATTTCLGCPLTIYIIHDPHYDARHDRRADGHPLPPRVVFEGGDSPCGRDRYRPRPARFKVPKEPRPKALKESSFKPLKVPRKSLQQRQKANKLSIRHFFRN